VVLRTHVPFLHAGGVGHETRLVFVSAWREFKNNLYDPGTELGVAQMPSEVVEYDHQQ
jgi:hypothetical protein